jgi:hypothetical protein
VNELNEVKEVNVTQNKELGNNKIKAFQNVEKLKEPPEHINTINEELEGKNHPVTDVPYRRKTIIIDCKKYEGVFPVFESYYDLSLPPELRKASDDVQFKYCTNKLRQQIEKDPELAKKFTPRQLEQIKAGEPRISGFTWHHNEQPGKMQLVDAEIHQKSSHTGGRSIWG